MTEKFRKCTYSYASSMNEKGSIMLEFAFVFPILVVFALTGYNLMRDMEVNMLKRDFSRSLILSYKCIEEGSPREITNCYDAAMNQLTKYAEEKYVLKKTTTATANTPAREKAGNFAYSIHTYSISDITKKRAGVTDSTFPINQARISGCRSTDPRILDAEIELVGGHSKIPDDSLFEENYSKTAVEERAGGVGETIRIQHLFPDNLLKSEEARRTLCLNGSITVAEVEFRLDKFFKFGRSPNSQNRYYELSFL